jgi:hypothetical protein
MRLPKLIVRGSLGPVVMRRPRVSSEESIYLAGRPVAVVAGWALGSAVRRLSHRTGVIDAEAFGTLPGNDGIPHPMVQWTTPHYAETLGCGLTVINRKAFGWIARSGRASRLTCEPSVVLRVGEPRPLRLRR